MQLIRARVAGRARVIGAGVSLFRYTIALGMFATPCRTASGWSRDVGERFGRYMIAGWRTVRCVPVSTGWICGGASGRRVIGCTVTVASRTLMLAKLATRAEVRASRANFGDLHKKAPAPLPERRGRVPAASDRRSTVAYIADFFETVVNALFSWGRH
ncbi:hypothetical protein HHL19_35705 [Streptomyces sp. R302]|uniref:hypothetical protein n=1 Tax=unclassified Streptomyces TaxID=2593676 RepID=UPI00145ECE44|nr:MULTISPECIES: hypothetical protein [unclassified Streptomyces]NML55114.1 hypothetical protein [Streptomyces sp. R301]NML83856.1 hypothetical protein [Streptomyces sp. R302]